mgnify:CR=1 FL=1
MKMDFLRAGAETLGLNLTAEHLRTFYRYWQELSEWNERVNLTTVTDCEGVQVRHFLDSLLPLAALRTVGWPPLDRKAKPSSEEGRGGPFLCADVGSGAGFPGVPLKIVCPSWSLVLVESVGKKAQFLRHLVQALCLQGVSVEQARAEDLGRKPGHREQYDLVVARAVADLRVLGEYTLPLVRRGGILAAHKGARAEREVWEAEEALNLLGGKVVRILSYELPGLVEPRRIVLVEKVATTPPQYPRRPGIPQKRPLGTPGRERFRALSENLPRVQNRREVPRYPLFSTVLQAGGMPDRGLLSARARASCTRFTRALTRAVSSRPSKGTFR